MLSSLSHLILATTERISIRLRDSANPDNDAEAPFSHLRPRKRRRHNDSKCPCPTERPRRHSPPDGPALTAMSPLRAPKALRCNERDKPDGDGDAHLGSETPESIS